MPAELKTQMQSLTFENWARGESIYKSTGVPLIRGRVAQAQPDLILLPGRSASKMWNDIAPGVRFENNPGIKSAGRGTVYGVMPREFIGYFEDLKIAPNSNILVIDDFTVRGEKMIELRFNFASADQNPTMLVLSAPESTIPQLAQNDIEVLLPDDNLLFYLYTRASESF